MSLFTDALATAADGDAGMITGAPEHPVRTSWREVREHAVSMAAVLAERGVRRGSAVAVLAGMPADIAPAAHAIWLAGGSVTMLHQPTARTDLAGYAGETATVLRVIGASCVVVGAPFDAAAESLAAAGVPVVTIAEMSAGTDARAATGALGTDAPGTDDAPGHGAALPAPPAESDTALLQLTSGSTATPKAVRITHGNLWANMEAMCAAAGLVGGQDVMVSWLPLFHDMGMVGFLTLPMCRGIDVVKVTPADFLRHPVRWPELISQYHGTCTAAPNFAYAITAKVLAREGHDPGRFDLSSLRFALNGAEPVDVNAARAFLAAGRPFGLPETAMVPAYGMAETTLGVSFHRWGTPMQVDTVDAAALENDKRAVPAICVESGRADGTAPDGATSAGRPLVRQFPVLGPPLPGIEVSVRAEDGSVRAEREVGVLHLRGDAVTSEYLTVDGPKATQDADNWLNTGDLGYLTDGRVVVCGRVKEVIIMGGRNIYPTDIERAAQAVEGVRAGNAAAVRWATSSGRESFAVVVESRQADDAEAAGRIADRVRSAVTTAINSRPALVRVVDVGTLPKTPSGKIKRAQVVELLSS